MTCQHDQGVSSELAGDGRSFVVRCLACEAVLEKPQTASNAQPAEQQSLPAIERHQPEPQKRRAAKRQQVGEGFDVLKMARARLREIKRELKRMAKLEAEAKKLQRLLDAADGRPVAVVRELKTGSK